MNDEAAKPSMLKRLLALVILVIAGWILLHFVIGLITGLATIIVIVLAIVAVIWALNTL
jgi:uncharacterized membrane protein YccC